MTDPSETYTPILYMIIARMCAVSISFEELLKRHLDEDNDLWFCLGKEDMMQVDEGRVRKRGKWWLN